MLEAVSESLTHKIIGCCINVHKELEPIHDAQLMTYRKLAKVPVGFLINFNTIKLKEGIKRFIKS